MTDQKWNLIHSLQEQEKTAQSKEARALFVLLDEKDKDLKKRVEELTTLQQTNDELQEKVKHPSRQMDSSTTEGGVVTALKEELKALESELIEKDYQTDLQQEKLKAAEEQLRINQLQIEQMNAKLKLRREELAAKDNLLNDKFTIKIPNEEQSFAKRLFGPSKAEQLEKQLIASKKASLGK